MVFYLLYLAERITNLKKLLSISKLSVQFNNLMVLKNVDVEIYDNKKIIGLIGPNGAGKTTLIHSVLGLNHIDSGSIKYYSKNKISYCPDTPEFESKLTCYEIMEQSLSLSRKSIVNKNNQIYDMLKTVGLEKSIYSTVQGFSRGMKQRLGIASALILNPDLIFLDEPTSALDPIGKEEIIQLINKISNNTNVVMSSHELNDVQKIASELIVLNDGIVIYQGALNEFLNNTEKYSFICFKNEKYLKQCVNLFHINNIEIKNIDLNKNQIHFNESNFEDVLSILNENCYGINEIIRKNNSLNDSFINNVKGLGK